MTESQFIIWTEKLAPEQRTVLYERFHQSPQDWPEAMRIGVDVLAKQRHPHNSEDVLEMLAEWMCLNPGV